MWLGNTTVKVVKTFELTTNNTIILRVICESQPFINV